MKVTTKQQNFNETNISHAVRQVQAYTPLEHELRTAIPTSAAAYHLNRKNQTLRAWACFENGPIKPVRINGRLAWPVKDLKNLLRLNRCDSENQENPNQIVSIANVGECV